MSQRHIVAPLYQQCVEDILYLCSTLRNQCKILLSPPIDSEDDLDVGIIKELLYVFIQQVPIFSGESFENKSSIMEVHESRESWRAIMIHTSS
jgi:hypothetical protein